MAMKCSSDAMRKLMRGSSTSRFGSLDHGVTADRAAVLMSFFGALLFIGRVVEQSSPGPIRR